MTQSIGHWLKNAQQLLSANSDSALIDAQVLLAHVLKKDRSYLYTWPENELTSPQMDMAKGLLRRRVEGEPVAYILGEKEFWSLPLYVDTSTLIPRDDTETLVEAALARLPQNGGSALDLGTGTGAIAIALAHERRDITIDAVDSSAKAVALAQRNARRHHLSHVRCFQSHWFERVKGKFHVIVSNPPYIDSKDPHLVEGDVRFEPHSALVSADAGLADLRHLAASSPDFLYPRGWLLVEHGWQQGEQVRSLFHPNFEEVETIKDLAGNPRVTLGRCRR